jgi:UDP-GlcNAc:undecaprenyl-phosphate GlcNAc-1-phosphate transferase
LAILLSFALAFLVAATLTPLCRAMSRRFGYVLPGADSARSASKAMFGGVPVVLTLFGCALAIGATTPLLVLLSCSAGLFVVGFASDLFTPKPTPKLIAVITAASAFLFFGYRLHWAESLTLDSLVTLFWIVGVTGAFNLLDHMDGLSAGTALIAGVAFLATILPVPSEGPLLLQAQYLAVLLGTLAGFLVYNIPPASISMGASGSLVVGLNMAAMTLLFAPGRGSNLLSVIAVPLLVLLVPIADASVTAVARLLSGRASAANHPSRRLVAMGLSERAAVRLFWTTAAVSGFMGVIADRGERGVTGVLAIMFTIGLALCALYLARVRVHDGRESDQDVRGTIVSLGIDRGYRRRLAEVLLDVVLVTVAYYSACRLRFDAVQWAENFPRFFQALPVVVGIQIVALFAAGAYRGLWRYFSLSDGLTFLKAVFFGAVTSQVALQYLGRLDEHAAGIAIIYSMLALLLITGSRASFRLLSEFIHRQRQAGQRLIVYGADDAGAAAVRFLLSDPLTTCRVIGFIDDNMAKRHVRVLGYPVIGGYDHLVGLVMAGEVDAVALAGDRREPAGLAALCAKHGVTLQRLAMTWRVITPPEAVVATGAARPAVESRVIAFTAASHPERVGRAPDPARERRLRGPRAVGDRMRDGVPLQRSEAANPPVRVAHVITRLILGGAQENTVYTAIGQHHSPQFDVTLLCGVDEAGEGNMFAEVNRAGVHTVVLPSLVREIRPLTDLKALFDLYRFLKAGSFTIVHTHSSKAGILGRIAARMAGVPVVVHTIHGVAFHEFQAAWKNQVFVVLERLCAPLSDRIISVSERISEAAIARGIGHPAQHTTIFSGIELDLFLSARERLTVAEAKRRAGIPEDAPVVGKIARMFPFKGHEQFFEVAAAIARQSPETWFLLVGDGPLREELRAEAARLGIADRVVMTGRVPPESVPDYIQAMDVVVHTSLREGIARVLPQAGAVGKPVVTFHLDGAPEVVRDGISGYLVPPLDVARAAERTLELLADPERRRIFGEAGRAFAAEHFSVEAMVDRIASVYVELLSQPVRSLSER